MGVFSNLSNEGLEETQDRLGGFAALETDAYKGKVKVAYAIKSTGGAQGVELTIEMENGRDYRETCYVTNKKGENFFLNKNDQTKKVPLPGFTVIDDLCIVTTEKPLKDQDTEEKIVMVYDYEQRKDVQKSVPVLVDLIGKEVSLGIVKTVEDKTKKNESSGNYESTGETREINTIEKIFHEPTKLTVPEVRIATAAGVAPEAAFYPAWVERNKGKTRDKSSKGGQNGSSGRPGSNAAPTAGEGGQRKSLFGS